MPPSASTTPAAVLMIQGTASHAGKSTLAAAFCRLFADEGLRVAPFKAQNMSLNAAVTPDGGEIGRAQYTQALAARTVPTVLMNPILLKPTDMRRSQVVVLGRATDTLDVRDYYARREELWKVVTSSLDTLRAEFDVVIIEGAGSPAEINLAQYDLVNMRVARHANAPVLLVGDIERGGVFASLYGTAMLLPQDDRRRIIGFAINKFRGDPTLLDPGFDMLLHETGIPTLGVLPWIDVALPEEDSLGIPGAHSPADALVDIAVIRLPHVANFDDFTPLAREHGVRVRYVSTHAEFGTPDLAILPGTKSTMADLAWLRDQHLDDALLAHRASGGPVLGVCGGFQMLGRALHDPNGVESATRSVPGLALLDVDTTFADLKVTRAVSVTLASARSWLGVAADTPFGGYEIHMGRTTSASHAALRVSPLETSAPHDDGALDDACLTMGTYVHGLFAEPPFRRALLARLAMRNGVHLPATADEDDPFDVVADLVRSHLDLPPIRRAMGLA